MNLQIVDDDLGLEMDDLLALEEFWLLMQLILGEAKTTIPTREHTK
jgi:hypothetical protein